MTRGWYDIPHQWSETETWEGGSGVLAFLGLRETGGVLDHIRCDLIGKRVSGETQVGFLLILEENKRFYSWKEKKRERGRKKRRECQDLSRRSVYHRVCVPFFPWVKLDHWSSDCVVVYSYLTQPPARVRITVHSLILYMIFSLNLQDKIGGFG